MHAAEESNLHVVTCTLYIACIVLQFNKHEGIPEVGFAVPCMFLGVFGCVHVTDGHDTKCMHHKVLDAQNKYEYQPIQHNHTGVVYRLCDTMADATKTSSAEDGLTSSLPSHRLCLAVLALPMLFTPDAHKSTPPM